MQPGIKRVQGAAKAMDPAPLSKVKCPKCGHINPAGQAKCSQCDNPLPRVRVNTPGARRPGMEQISFKRGQVIANRYTVLEMIGRGGMGCIFKAHDNVLKEEIALKTLLPQFAKDKLVVERFYNEARIARSLSFPKIARVHDIGMTGEVLYISMEYIKGQSLRALLDNLPEGRRLPIVHALYIIDSLCEALEYAHQYTIHRDIKPENVMISEHGQVKLMDFGISKLVSHTQLTGTSVVMGTPHYMSPEQLRDSAKVDPRSDVYSVGVVMYEILTGNLPMGVPRAASQLMPEVPAALDPIIQKCMEPKPNDRFNDITELRNALRPIRELVNREGPPGGETSFENLRGGPAPGVGHAKIPDATPRFRALGIALVAAIILFVAVGVYGLETQRAGANEATAAGVGMDPGTSHARFIQWAERARDRFAENDSGSVRDRELRRVGERWLNDARAAAEAGEADRAHRYAWYALQTFAGPRLAPSGMVFVPPGRVTLLAGSASCEAEVAGFFIDRHEVTNEHYRQFAQEAGNDWPLPRSVTNGDPAAPVTMVTFYEAMACAAHFGKTLPTEAQWARAAYGALEASEVYPWGSDWEEGAANTAADEEHSGPAPVGLYTDDETFWGCRDMAGNVTEWTRTPARADACDPRAPLPRFGESIALRGGNFAAQPVALMSRATAPFEERLAHVGFRCVKPFPTDLEAIRAAL
jgi:tRNA A-37 threonylcarbamoyl transferase component Bud32